MRVRPPRGMVTTVTRPNALGAKEALIWVDGNTLYINGMAAGPILTDSKKQLVSMGAYLIIWPDKVWINTTDVSQFGYLENTVETAGETAFSLCREDGTAYENYTISQQPPEAPENGTFWMDTSLQDPVLRYYTQDGWMPAAETCVKISAGGIGRGFSEGDGVEIEGCGIKRLNGQTVLQRVEENAIIIRGIAAGTSSQQEKLTVKRSVPEMDFVVECGNRLWGCKYGIVRGQAVNAIYASKLGDFKNWNCYAGRSTDSYAAVRGSDGPFTGAASYLGCPIFFKEQCMERVYPSASGAHQVVTMTCAGVKRGSENSIASADGKLYYHGLGGVYSFDGSMPTAVSQQLGHMELQQAAAGALEGKYYLSGENKSGIWQMLVYDTQLQLWFCEDETHAVEFARRGEELFCLTADGRILAMLGSTGEMEAPIRWIAESGEIGLDTAQHKYPVRLSVRMALPDSSEVQAFLSSDGGQTWRQQGKIYGQNGTKRCLLHLRPERMGQIKVRLEGLGDCTIYSMTAVYEKGSDGP